DGEVARFGQPPRVPRAGEEAVEIRGIETRRWGQREYPLERLVGERQPPLGIEQRDPDRQQIQHRPLRFAERAELAALLLHLLDVDGVAGDAFLAERQVAHAQRAAL